MFLAPPHTFGIFNSSRYLVDMLGGRNYDG